MDKWEVYNIPLYIETDLLLPIGSFFPNISILLKLENLVCGPQIQILVSLFSFHQTATLSGLLEKKG